MLSFGIKAMILVKIDIPNLWVLGYNKKQNSKDLWANLNLAEEVRLDAELRIPLN